MPQPKLKVLNSQIYKALWHGLRPQIRLFCFSFVLLVLSSVAAVTVPIFYKKFFDVIELANDKLATGPILVNIILIIAFVNFLKWLLFRSAIFINQYIETESMARLRQQAFNKTMLHSHGFFVDNFTGSLVQKIGRFSRSFEKVFDTLLYELLPLVITVLGAAIVTYTINPVFSMIIGLWVVFFLVFNLIYSRFMMKHDIASAAADSKTGATLADAIGNHSAITHFTAFIFEQDFFKSVTRDQAIKTRRAWNVRAISSVFQTLLLFIVEFLVFFYAIRFWQNDAITVGTFVLVQIYVIGVSNQLWGLSRVIRNFYEAMADSREMVEIMLLPKEIIDAPDARNLSIKNGQIDFDNVSFAYGATNKEVLANINLTIAPGEKVGLIGPSGAGKTTITRLLLRLHNASAGEILIDDQDIAQVTQESLRKNISLVPQDPVLFHRSLFENIKYGRRDATEEEVIAAAKLAHCDEFIDVLPNKYDTLVGERGVKLSGGERQRIAIARAILKNAPILILDEATSSLDSHSESLIQEALDTLMRGRTAIVIAHRLSTIRKMDRIIVMENGAIREEGTHADLIANESSLYKKLWDLQMGGFIVE